MKIPRAFLCALPYLWLCCLNADAQTCANRRVGSHNHFQGTSSASIPVQGLPTYVQQGILKAGELWKTSCSQANIPDFNLDTGSPPPPNNSYDPSQTLQVRFEDREPNFDQQSGSWITALHTDTVTGNTLTLPKKCPQPQPGVPPFAFCDPSNTLIAWDSQHGQKVIAHELGHALSLGHDTCATNSLMNEVTQSNAVLRTEHCELANSLNCDPANPPQGGCPQAPDAVPFTVEATGLSQSTAGALPERLIVTRQLTDDKGNFAGQSDLTFDADGQKSFDDIIHGWSFTISIFMTNRNKTCTASPDAGANVSSAVTVRVDCVCTSSPLIWDGRVAAALTTDCPHVIPDPSELEPFTPVVPTFGDPWYISEFGPGSEPFGEPCKRQTVCTEGEEEVTLDDGTVIVTQVLNCVDMCVSPSSAPTLHGPSTVLELPGGTDATDGTLTVSGWSVDRDGVENLAFYVDGERVTLTGYSEGLSRPEACSQVQGPNAINCNSNSGFQGTLDATTLTPGSHILQVVAVDSYSGYPAGTLVKKSFTVPSCFDQEKPSATVTSPANGAVVGGSISIQASASDNEGIQRVDFLVDGVKQGSDFTAPYSFLWDTTAINDGSHNIRVRAVDTCSNKKASTAIGVTVDNVVSPPVIVSHPQSQEVSRLASPTFSVGATGEGTLRYQWQRNGVNLLEGGHFRNVKSPTLTVLSVTGTEVGDYRCVVSNQGGSRVSNSARLSIAPNCEAGATTLCLANQRFSVRVAMENSPTSTIPHSEIGGFFWHYEPESVDVAVKIIDATSVNGHFWVFHGSLTSTPYSLTVTDTTTDKSRSYSNNGTFCGGADTFTFSNQTNWQGLGLLAMPTHTACSPGPTTACLYNSRFKVEVFASSLAQGAVALTNKSASFWFGQPDTPEVVVKIINGTVVNGRWWVFYGSLTNQSYSIRITDTATGVWRMYYSPAAHCGSADTAAF